MTYNVFGGTLNLALSIYLSLSPRNIIWYWTLLRRLRPAWQKITAD